MSDLLWRFILGLLGAGVLGAGLFIWSGAYDVAATKGHWPPVRAILAYAMRQSVATHSAGIIVPELDDPVLIRRGAAHFQGGCAACHSAPGQPPSPVTRGMLPEPPELGPRIGAWRPEELFRLVMHGIKYTGMPAWPAPERDDEAWAVVAFLRRMPGLDDATYRRLAFGALAREREEGAGDAEPMLRNGPPGEDVASCARCHGLDGAGDPDGAFPRLAGQSEAYLLAALRDYAGGTRPSGIMRPVAAALTEAEMVSLARHYAAQRVPAANDPADTAMLERGRQIATEGLPRRGVAPCAACHGGDNPRYPRLAGQHPRILEDQMLLWMQGARTPADASPRARIMAQAVGAGRDLEEHRWPLTRQDIRAVAAWYATQHP